MVCRGEKKNLLLVVDFRRQAVHFPSIEFGTDCLPNPTGNAAVRSAYSYSSRMKTWIRADYFRTAHASPSGPFPVAMRPVTARVLRSTTATLLSELTATNA